MRFPKLAFLLKSCNFGWKLQFWLKVCILVKSCNFGQMLQFWSIVGLKLQFFWKITSFAQKFIFYQYTIFWWKIVILTKKKSNCQILKIMFFFIKKQIWKTFDKTFTNLVRSLRYVSGRESSASKGAFIWRDRIRPTSRKFRFARKMARMWLNRRNPRSRKLRKLLGVWRLRSNNWPNLYSLRGRFYRRFILWSKVVKCAKCFLKNSEFWKWKMWFMKFRPWDRFACIWNA